ncbi:MAG: TonB-dependent receptor, partial [Nevskiaceae bacterium]
MQSNSLLALGVCLACCAFPAAAQTGGDAAAARAVASSNPRISLILQGTFADYGSDEEAEVPGVLLGGHRELRPAGFSLAESELVLESNVDNLFRGWATVALENEEGEIEVALEEAYANTLALPGGLGLKFGRFFSDIGYLNRVHSHAWEFVEQPLVYRALLGGNFGDDGVQLRWVAPTDLFVELGGEALRGDGFPAGGHERDGVN